MMTLYASTALHSPFHLRSSWTTLPLLCLRDPICRIVWKNEKIKKREEVRLVSFRMCGLIFNVYAHKHLPTNDVNLVNEAKWQLIECVRQNIFATNLCTYSMEIIHVHNSFRIYQKGLTIAFTHHMHDVKYIDSVATTGNIWELLVTENTTSQILHI